MLPSLNNRLRRWRHDCNGCLVMWDERRKAALFTLSSSPPVRSGIPAPKCETCRRKASGPPLVFFLLLIFLRIDRPCPPSQNLQKRSPGLLVFCSLQGMSAIFQVLVVTLIYDSSVRASYITFLLPYIHNEAFKPYRFTVTLERSKVHFRTDCNSSYQFPFSVPPWFSTRSTFPRNISLAHTAVVGDTTGITSEGVRTLHHLSQSYFNKLNNVDYVTR